MLIIKTIINVGLIATILYKIYIIKENKSTNKKTDCFIIIVCVLLGYLFCFAGFIMLPNVKHDNESISNLWKSVVDDKKLCSGKYKSKTITDDNFIYYVDIFDIEEETGMYDNLPISYYIFSKYQKAENLEYFITPIKCVRRPISRYATPAQLYMRITDGKQCVNVVCRYNDQKGVGLLISYFFPPSLFNRRQVDITEIYNTGEDVKIVYDEG